jgi:putative addiction module component (TIGR02574 family)
MIPAIKNMTTDEKIALVEALWEEIEKERANPLSNKQVEHIRKRIEEHNRIYNLGKPWDDVKRKYTIH